MNKQEPMVEVMHCGNWIVFQSTRDKTKYVLIDFDKDPHPFQVKCIATDWITDEEYATAHTRYDNDYFGEFGSITDLSDPRNKDGMLSGKKFVGWFKTIDEEQT